jgi:hypothetical protein
MAAQFAPKPWRGSDGKLLPEYLEYVASHMKKGGDMHPKVMASRHIDKLEKAQDYETLELYLEQCQSAAQKKAATAPPPIAIDTSQMSPDEYRAYIDRRRTELIGGGAA